MAYRNKTYVIFDGDENLFEYKAMLQWVNSEHIDFNFYNAHDLNVLRDGSSEETVKAKLRERLGNTKQIVLVEEKTKNLYKFVRWEIEMCLNSGIPIVAVNQNQKRSVDADRCPPILRGTPTVHVAYRAKIIQHALDDFCGNFSKYKGGVDWVYSDEVYRNLGLI